MLNLEDKNGDGFLHEREDGDGHEQPETAPDLMDGAGKSLSYESKNQGDSLSDR